MANFVTDFNLPNGTTLPSGLVARNGTFEIVSGRLEGTGSNPGGPSWIATFTSTAADIYTEITISARTSVTSAYGPVVRYSDNSNMWLAVIGSTGLLSLFDRIAGSFTSRATYQIENYDPSDIFKFYTIGLFAAGNEFAVYLDGIERITHTSSFNNTAVQHGVRLGDTVQSTYSLRVCDDAIVSNTPDKTFRQRVGSNASFPFSGRFVGTVTNMEISIDGGTFLTGESSPTSNTYSFNTTVNTGQHTIDLRFSNDTSITASIDKCSVGAGIPIVGQSNGAGRLENNSLYSSNRVGIEVILLATDDVFKSPRDPISDQTGQVDAVLLDPNAKGSWFLRFAEKLQNTTNIPICIIPCCQGGTSIDQWLPTSTDTVSGINRFESLERRINLIGGCEQVVFDQGETDASALTLKSTYQTKLSTIADDLNATFGCSMFIRPLQTIGIDSYNGNGTTTGQDAIRQAQIDEAALNSNLEVGQSISDIDINRGDALHFLTDEEGEQVAQRMYDSFVGFYSESSITVGKAASGIPNGTFPVRLYSSTQGTLIFEGSAAFISGISTFDIVAESGDIIFGYVDDDSVTPSDGAFLVSTVA